MTAAAVLPSRKLRLSVHDGHSGGVLSYLEMGRADAAPIVFIHGFGADLLTWQLCLVPMMGAGRVIALDLPGHGRSTPHVGDASLKFMADWLGESLDLLGIKSARLVGHSMGAKIALGFTASHPERVEALALISPAGLGGAFHHAALDRFLVAPNGDTAEIVAAQLLGPKGGNLLPSVTRAMRDATSDPVRRAALAKLLGQAKLHGHALSPDGFDWTKIRCPLALIWGDHDRLIPMPAARYLPPNIPVQVLDGVGHLPHMEASAEVVRRLKEFLT